MSERERLIELEIERLEDEGRSLELATRQLSLECERCEQRLGRVEELLEQLLAQVRHHSQGY